MTYDARKYMKRPVWTSLDRGCTGPNQDRSDLVAGPHATARNCKTTVQSGLWRVARMRQPVAVAVASKIGKRPDRTGL
jgi:hypothetical protein